MRKSNKQTEKLVEPKITDYYYEAALMIKMVDGEFKSFASDKADTMHLYYNIITSERNRILFEDGIATDSSVHLDKTLSMSVEEVDQIEEVKSQLASVFELPNDSIKWMVLTLRNTYEDTNDVLLPY